MGYYRKFLRDLSKRIRPTTYVLRKGVKSESTSTMEVIVIFFRACHSTDFGYPRLGRRDNSRPFRLYRDTSRDGFGTTLEQTNQTAPSAPSSLSVAPS